MSPDPTYPTPPLTTTYPVVLSYPREYLSGRADPATGHDLLMLVELGAATAKATLALAAYRKASSDLVSSPYFDATGPEEKLWETVRTAKAARRAAEAELTAKITEFMEGQTDAR